MGLTVSEIRQQFGDRFIIKISQFLALLCTIYSKLQFLNFSFPMHVSSCSLELLN